MNKPNFFIVGTPKSGTTSLFNYLEEHPEIFLPTVKEPHFFSQPEVGATYYKTTLIDTLEDYLRLYKKADGFKAVGDLSSSYLYYAQSATRIKEFNPKAKIVIILRNPVERAVSHYLMDYHLNLIRVPLLEVLTNQPAYPQFYEQYVELGRYEKQLENYLSVFDRERILLLLSDELFQQTEKTVAGIFEFLKVDHAFKPDFSKRYNQFKAPRYKVIGSIKNTRLVQAVYKVLPNGLKRWASSAAFDTSKEKPSFEQESKLLRNLFQEDLKRTEALINKDLSAWKKVKH